ncbi:MAG: hypothetical protein CMJ75_12470 [Planctomycetaceae bacterium]|nr:hypothetical protein [Planctomycetaceae bacterium]
MPPLPAQEKLRCTENTGLARDTAAGQHPAPDRTSRSKRVDQWYRDGIGRQPPENELPFVVRLACYCARLTGNAAQ